MVWCQEEPKNMGSWSFVEPYLEWVLKTAMRRSTRPRYVGRPASASTATGLMSLAHRGTSGVPRRGIRRVTAHWRPSGRAGRPGRPTREGQDHGDRNPRADAGRMRYRGHHRPLVQEAWRRREGRRAARRARDRQGHPRSQCAGRRRRWATSRQGWRDGRRRAPSSARSSKAALRRARRQAGPPKAAARRERSASCFGDGFGCRLAAASAPLLGRGAQGQRSRGRSHRGRKRRRPARASPEPARTAASRRATCLRRSQRAARLRSPAPAAPVQVRAPSAPSDVVARGAREDDEAAPDHRAPPQGSAEHRRHADDVQRRRHERGDGAAQRSTRTRSRRSTA